MENFDYKGAKKAGYSDEEIVKNLSQKYNFDLKGAKKAGYNEKEILTNLIKHSPSEEKRPQRENQVDLLDVGKSYAAGLGGGAGGFPEDVARLFGQPTGLKSSHELSEGFGGEAKTGAERIARHAGEWGGMEGLIGTATGGPSGAAIGTAHGSISGAVFGGLKEAGLSENWALGLTAGLTVSPIALRKLLPKLLPKMKAGMTFEKALQKTAPKIAEQIAEVPKGQMHPEKTDAVVEAFKPVVEEIKYFTAPIRSVGEDVRKITTKAISKDPVVQAVESNPIHKVEVAEKFGELDALAHETPGLIFKEEVIGAIDNQIKNLHTKGIALSEYEREVFKDLKKFKKEIQKNELTFGDLYDQFRKNNRAKSEILDPSKTRGYNKAKSDALGKYNSAIEEIISDLAPEGAFKQNFKPLNQEWTKINDYETVQTYLGDAFGKTIDFKLVKNLIGKDTTGAQRSFINLMGDKKFKSFQGILKELLKEEKAISKTSKVSELEEKGAETLLEKLPYGKAIKRGGKALINHPGTLKDFRKSVKNFDKEIS